VSLRDYLFHEEPGITLYCGDCREILPLLDSLADSTVTDPPYGIGMTSFADDFAAGVHGVNVAPGYLAAVFSSPRRIGDLIAGVRTWEFERLLWMHKSADIAHPWHGWHMNSEAVAIFSRKAARWPIAQDTRSDLYQVGPWERGGHPNEKPLTVVQDIVRRVTRACVVDPFAGTGTTLVAAKSLGLTAIGIEIEPKYCEIAVKRLRQEVLPL
jgi:DNA modification methylase